MSMPGLLFSCLVTRRDKRLLANPAFTDEQGKAKAIELV